MNERIRDELAASLQVLMDTSASAAEIAEAALSSPSAAALQAEAWELGYAAGHAQGRRQRY